VYLVDLPGYGYARGGSASQRELAGVADAYFTSLEHRRPHDGGGADRRRDAVFLLVDARHPGLASDVEAAHWLATRAPLHIVATKVDKLSRSERTKNLRLLERQLETPVLPTAAVSGEGLDELWTLIARLTR
jgi:GTP-binding protein